MPELKNQMLHGDCVEILRRAKAPFADRVFADPPFDIGYKYDKYHDKKSSLAGKMSDDLWNEHPRIRGTFAERTGFSCQMPESLLARIIRVNSV